jgi:hypothetical protein
MSRDADAQQRLWLSFGYGGKKAPQPTWRYWQKAKGSAHWIISAPNAVAEFELQDKTVFYHGELVLTGRTQWAATWATLAYFYEKVVPTLQPPPISDR